MPQDELQQAPVQQTTSRENLRPVRTLNLLSYREIQSLMSANEEVRSLFRLCALAVLNSGNEIDDVSSLMESY
ncbi:MAG: pyrimidine/purine nucleosidase domain-containing protein, partial [OM182 bacterium]|nr:pyrimidine/purine nucleosidase domain-containing protein [OM182 bacterium]